MTESRFAEGEVGADRDAGAKVRPLPAGHRLGEFELDSVLGTGGFGIVYRAFDRTLQRTVAVKEYMPAMLAQRAGDCTVGLRASRYAHAFEAGRTAFLNEARLLAQFDHPGLLKVLHFWESHGTAYMVMPYYEGQTLASRSRKAGPMHEHELLDLFAALLGALHTLHRAQCFHRDISLDNILVRRGGQPVLLDFGAARKLIGDLVDETAMILKPGYAPIEQYTDDPAFKQGPWTDIYALGAVAYALITGDLPPAAVVRSIQDQYRPLAGRTFGDDGVQYSERVLNAIDEALALKIEDRPESVQAFAQRLGLRETAAGVFAAADHGPAAHAATRAAAGLAPLATANAVMRSGPETDAVMPEAKEAKEASGAELTGDVEPESGGASQNGARAAPTAEARLGDHPPAPIPAIAPAADNDVLDERTLRQAIVSRRFAFPALALLVIVVAGIALLRLAIRLPSRPASVPVAQTTAQATPQLAPPRPVDARPASVPAATAHAAANVAATASSPVSAAERMASASALPAPAHGAPGPDTTAAGQTSAPGETASPADSATSQIAAVQPPAMRPVLVRLHVFPWGEVYVNGVKRGISPPFRSMSLAPGTYRIEVRNGTLPPLVRMITLDAGEPPVEIRHSFE